MTARPSCPGATDGEPNQRAKSGTAPLETRIPLHYRHVPTALVVGSCSMECV